MTNNVNFKQLRNDLNKAMEEVAKKHGVTLKANGIKYSDFDFTIKVEGVVQNKDVDGDKELFNQYCTVYGFKQEDYQRKLIVQGKEFTFVGFNPRKPKNCCSIKEVGTGKVFICPKETVVNCFA